MKPTKAVLLLALASFAAASWAQHHDHRMVTPAELKWSDVPTLPPGAKVAVIEGPMNQAVPFTVRLKFPDNYSIPPHFAWTSGETIVQLHGTGPWGVTYLNPADDPRKQ